ncbi:MAG: 16S rRNA (adenine(1518)-N(6)/adenine(1519)-N(6))-dimethyltransferase RsmA [Oscillospiraceae bacterium]|nr:16S rRNA (adenine(1518)-N(6)/adenine(1519)-N(6))-dimethyltransferase RsmA [Oscillospiraceae bacterium]
MTKYAPGKEQHKAKKSLGQNFLVDSTVCPRIAEKAKIDGIGVLEIGPGFGALTVELAKRAAKVVAIEIDEDVIPQLLENLKPFSNVTVIKGDAMEIDLHSLITEQFGDMPVAIVGNLPYYITSPLMMRFLEEELPVESVTVMVQKEAGQRLCAIPGSRECGAVSAAVWYYSEPKILFEVKPGAFRPQPKVTSCVIRLKIRKEPLVEVSDNKWFFKVVRAAFGQRRKTALNAISALLGISKDDVRKAMKDSGIQENARAEALTMEMFAVLADNLRKC